jgi:23S rRNA (cytidine1920-2'-O)/16S rRNA (cytidine1409-2'-O)-methyltransferase
MSGGTLGEDAGKAAARLSAALGLAPRIRLSSPAMRLDQLLVDRGLYDSREKARRAVMAGQVKVGGRVLDKPGTAVAADAVLEVEAPPPYVSRAGGKLAAALDAFGVSPAGWTCLDVGASTGGFTDCLLQRGATRVYALDVGKGQLVWKLRQDARVVAIEGVNVRHLEPDALPERVALATVDVSFISLLKVVPALLPHLVPGGLLLTLVKPQFEAGREAVGKGGIVRDEATRRGVIDQRVREIAALGFTVLGAMDSPVAGAEGNVEGLALFRFDGPAPAPAVG